ncbi:N-acetyldiaminopimelate deacetylase [Ligilactobacillus sp. Marseille-Q7487]|mgnify:CR=1 FL=1|jgi:N-acetyldiaminopimelate deacetylase|uniref:N-acetyldiaminopimelate deacetylase n=1 Tax=Ligilactobacillus sp. Marseille-Q7487 TaxID=3022128 RepID=UPI0015B5FB8A|nr:N-acetyldiaminopimelate deacetylase [Ligilactobacillus sp. Marseille-Q7487]
MMFSEEQLIEIRRSLHQIPEIGMEEFETSKKLKEIIAQLPQKYLEIKTWQTAIMVKVTGKDTTKTLGYRTDIDGLPVSEATNLPYASKHLGKMHACGHDLHMTIALGILSYFANHQPQYNLIFIFQPAEENESGGKQMYENNALGDWKIDEIYALHDNPQLPVGTIGCCQGTLFAGTCEIHIRFIGKSGHAAYPHLANDMVVCGAQFVTQTQTVVSRNIDPIQAGVITLGHFNAGTTGNVIAGECRIDGTIRALTQENNLLLQKRVREIAQGIAQSFACEVKIDLHQGGYLPVENNPQTTACFIEYMQQNPDVNFVQTSPAMTGEDFGFWLSKIPGTMFWLGVDCPYALHSEHFNPNEAAIMQGVTSIIGYFKHRQQLLKA